MAPRTFIIGDVHGCVYTLRHLLFRVIRLRSSDRLYFLGDLVDRGPGTKEVLDTIIRLQSAGYSIHSVRGNHEQMLLESCSNRNSFHLWMENGGIQTLKSFGVEDACEIALPYQRFLSGLPHYILLDRFVLCHAGINCQAADPFSDTESMLWSRDLPVIPSRIGDRKIICGHTVHSLAEISESLAGDRITIDGGCVFSERKQLGNLVAIEIDSLTIHHTRNIDV